MILFFEDAFRSRLLQNGFPGYLPTPPIIEFVISANDSRAILTVRPPSASLPFDPDVSNEENKSVDEAEVCGEWKVRLKLFSCVLRNKGEPSGKTPSADLPWKAGDQRLTDSPRTVVRFATHWEAERAAGFLVLLEFRNRADKREAPALMGERFADGSAIRRDGAHG